MDTNQGGVAVVLASSGSQWRICVPVSGRECMLRIRFITGRRCYRIDIVGQRSKLKPTESDGTSTTNDIWWCNGFTTCIVTVLSVVESTVCRVTNKSDKSSENLVNCECNHLSPL